MTRSFTYALAFVLVIWMSLALPGVARELAQDGKCTPDTLRVSPCRSRNRLLLHVQCMKIPCWTLAPVHMLLYSRSLRA
jgi:hypothetical protein